MGGWIYAYLTAGKSIAALSRDELRSMQQFANAAGALTTTKKGAIPALPSLEEIRLLIEDK